MVQSVTYQSETKTVPFQGKTIVLESLTPVLSPKEKEKRKKEIERCLYEVFSKYRVAGDKRRYRSTTWLSGAINGIIYL